MPQLPLYGCSASRHAPRCAELATPCETCDCCGLESSLYELRSALTSHVLARRLSEPQQHVHQAVLHVHHPALHASVMQAAVAAAWQHAADFDRSTPAYDVAAAINASVAEDLAHLHPLQRLTNLECDATLLMRGSVPVNAGHVVALAQHLPHLQSLRMRQYDWQHVTAHEVSRTSKMHPLVLCVLMHGSWMRCHSNVHAFDVAACQLLTNKWLHCHNPLHTAASAFRCLYHASTAQLLGSCAADCRLVKAAPVGHCSVHGLWEPAACSRPATMHR